jgi:hypothetical protein
MGALKEVVNLEDLNPAVAVTEFPSDGEDETGCTVIISSQIHISEKSRK